MEYSKLIAVSGLPGLFELINSKGDGAIVRSLEDQSTKFISNRVHSFSHLDSIEVYTEQENVSLAEVLLAMKSANENLPDEKDAEAVRKYFDKVYPRLDFERVYSSDLRKMVRWFSILQQHNIDIQLPDAAEEEQVEELKEEDPKQETAEAASQKKGKRK